MSQPQQITAEQLLARMVDYYSTMSDRRGSTLIDLDVYQARLDATADLIIRATEWTFNTSTEDAVERIGDMLEDIHAWKG